jgi:hypothetical protein
MHPAVATAGCPSEKAIKNQFSVYEDMVSSGKIE